MKEDKKTKTETVNKLYDPDRDPEAKAGTDQFPRVKADSVTGHPSLVTGEKTRKKKIFKVSLWIAVPAAILAIVLWVLYNWLGLWIWKLYDNYDWADKACLWSFENLPVWITGKGVMRTESVIPILLIANCKKTKAVPFFTGFLDHPDPEYRRRAIYAFPAMGEDIPEPVLPLFKALSDNEPQVCNAAVDAIETISGPSCRCHISFLIDNLQSSNPLKRECAAYILGAIGPEAESAITGLINLFNDPVRTIAFRAIQSIGLIGKNRDNVVPELLKIINKEKLGLLPFLALADLRPVPKDILPIMKTMLRTDNRINKIGAIFMVGIMGSKKAK